MDDASKVLASMADNKDVTDEISFIISKHMYSDDFVFFRDLFNPEDNKVLKSAGFNQSVFESEFDRALDQMKLKSTGFDDLKQFLIDNNLALYVPYPLEEYNENNRIPTISFHPLVNDSINCGYEYKSETGLKSTEILSDPYEIVTVNEEYAEEKPVYLIVPKEIEEPTVPTIDPIDPVATNEINEVKVGWVYLTKQLDGLFDGGSELRFEQGAVNVGTDGHVTGTFTTYISCDISRWRIGKAMGGYESGFVSLSVPWDTNWKPEETENIFGVWEEDKKSELTFGSTAKFTFGQDVKDTTTGIEYKKGQEISMSISKKIYSQDQIIYVMPWDRNWYFATNKANNGWSFNGSYLKDGFAFRRLSNYLIITTPHRVLNY
ncbi:hypothetical protein [Saccharicrinis sp. FJH54]|uniref:hypothetical protein n=1 Tax=Saccharicrinis sp. FJH54 TaxID=3344665 RepID=UPI0035D51653